MRYEQQRAEIIEVCLRMRQMEFFLGTWGNVSVRVGGHILLTPSKVDYDVMRPEDLVVIDTQGNRVEGERTATSEKEVHRQIYVARADVGAIIHAHTKKAMAVSATALREVPCLVEEMSQLLGGAIPLAGRYVPAEQHVELGGEAGKVIGQKSGIILRNHGPVACGRDLREAALVAQVIEKSCDIYLSLCGPLAAREIPGAFVESERYRFVHTYGHEQT
ncbi:MAG TPA: class II aldolase family protein [Clostridiales bacterium]|nr:class II aldolase family protein [Clostridiales bacterium]